MSSPGLEGIDGAAAAQCRLLQTFFETFFDSPGGLVVYRVFFCGRYLPAVRQQCLLPVSPYSTAGSGRPATSLDSLLTWSLRCWPSSDYTPPVPSLMQTYTTVVSQVHGMEWYVPRYSLPSKVPCTVHRHPGGPIHCAKMSPRAHCYGTFPPPGHLGQVSGGSK